MKKLLYIAPMSEKRDTAHGYANSADGLFDVLTEMKKENLLDFDAFNSNESFIIDDVYEFCFVIIHPSVLSNHKNALNFYKYISTKCKYMYLTILWEATPLPKAWNDLLNSDVFNGFLCPCTFINSLLDGYDKPKFYLPYLLDEKVYKSIDIRDKEKENIFTVYCGGQLTERKAFKEAVIVFSKALGDKEDCRLIIKSNRLGGMEDDIDDVIARYSHLNGLSNASIYCLKDKNIKQKEIVELYHSSSVVLLLGGREGFGFPLLEAMSCGLPAIYNNWSSWLDDIYKTDANKPSAYYIDYVTSMSTYGFDSESMWSVPLINDAVKHLRDSYESWKANKKEYYEKSYKNREVIHNNFSYGAIKNHILSIFNGEEMK